MIPTRGYAAYNPTDDLRPFEFERRDLLPRDVQMEILYCGVCHSDLHQVKNEWGGTHYPLVPGHEIVGRILDVGSQVKKFKAGDLAAIGCLVNSCRECSNCRKGLEQYCINGFTGTYNSLRENTGKPTYGGYSKIILADEHFALSIPQNLPLEGVAPLLCAGITTYSPLRKWKVGNGHKLGVVGLGGLVTWPLSSVLHLVPK